MKLDLHVHTTYSKHWFWGTDALDTPRDMIKAAIRRGLDGLAITDHENVRGSLAAKEVARSLKKGFKIITGSEIKTASGHMLGLGITEDVRPGLSIRETVENIHDLGGVAVAAHPFAEYGMRKCMKEKAVLADAIEVFNASSCRKLQNMKALRFARSVKKPMTAGSDSHLVSSIGNAGIICHGDPLSCIKKGDTEVFGELTPLRIVAYHLLSKLTRSLAWKMTGSTPR